ncbi:MAG: hypothetical protein LBS25_03275 [Candidatus Symbiothrix sp.]|jgi:hypothetical protein|nr:hypothetical protein [Candidatus Symbiothrix sp.]
MISKKAFVLLLSCFFVLAIYANDPPPEETGQQRLSKPKIVPDKEPEREPKKEDSKPKKKEEKQSNNQPVISKSVVLNVQSDVRFSAQRNLVYIAVTASNSNWEMTQQQCNWDIIVTKYSNNEIKIICSENQGLRERSCDVTVKLGSETRTLRIKQAGAEPYLSIDQNTVDFSTAGGEHFIAVNTNMDNWNISSEVAGRFKISKAGKGVRIAADPNTNASAYNSEFNITAGNMTRKIKVNQSGVALNIDIKSKNFGSSGGNQKINITTSNENGWYIPDEKLPAGFEITAKDKTSITINCRANSSVDSRSAHLKVKSGEVTETIYLSQDGVPVTLALSSSTLKFKRSGKHSGGNSVYVETNDPSWQITDKTYWCNVSKSGKSIVVTADKNTGTTREGLVKIVAKNEIRYITVMQEGRTLVDPTLFVDWRMSPPTSYIGGSIGLAKRWGGYLAFRASASMFNPYPDVFENEEINNLWTEDLAAFDKTYKRFSLTAGPMFRVTPWLYLYGGLGYGLYAPLYYSKVEDDVAVALVEPDRISGLEVEYGAKFNLGGFTLSAGHSSILGSKFGELHLGIGAALDDRSLGSLFGGNDFNNNYLDFDRDDMHQAAGGFHLRSGFGVSDMGNPLWNLDGHYNNSKLFPINVEIGVTGSLDGIEEFLLNYMGLYSSLHLTKGLTIDFGGGYQYGERNGGVVFNSDENNWEYGDQTITQPYYKLGISYMFDGKSWGGFNYSYRRGFAGQGTPFGMHTLTYTLGQTASGITIGVGLCVGLAAWLAGTAEYAESNQTY